jgi:hypothetical protein
MSCVGLILRVYEAIGEALLPNAQKPEDPANQPVYPEFTWDELVELYGWLKTCTDVTRERFGLPDDGPYRVILPGYLFHALANPLSFAPTKQHARYP